MANPEHLKILKKGVGMWNRWREENRKVLPDLRGIELIGMTLTQADLRDVELRSANLAAADLNHADLRRADLRHTDLSGAQLCATDLRGANLTAVGLGRANLFKANLGNAELVSANLSAANFNGADLSNANFMDSQMYLTNINDVDLRQPEGLDSILHRGPSSIGVDTLRRSLGQIPESFLKECGLSSWEIEAAKFYNPDLSEAERIDIAYEIVRIQSESAVQISPLFLSYSHADGAFVEAIEDKLNAKGIRFWRDVHDMKAGRIEKQIDRAMRLNPTVLLVLSEHSVESDWVEWEASKARELERQYRKESTPRDVLCPVALDEAWKTCDWEGPLRRQIEKYFVLDFSAWEERETFDRQFGRLAEGLGLFYPGQKGGNHGQP